MTHPKPHVCPVTLAGHLDSRLRRWVQNPEKMLGPYIDPGMVVLDVGCGPGFFSIPMARLVGPTGQVIAADLQPGMLERLRTKIKDTSLEARITLHQCAENAIGVAEAVDLVVLFYMVHEVAQKAAFFSEIESILKTGGRVFMVEPPLHVSQKAFEQTIALAQQAGLAMAGRPHLLFSKAALLRKDSR